jgi:hypothetical protein
VRSIVSHALAGIVHTVPYYEGVCIAHAIQRSDVSGQGMNAKIFFIPSFFLSFILLFGIIPILIFVVFFFFFFFFVSSFARQLIHETSPRDLLTHARHVAIP